MRQVGMVYIVNSRTEIHNETLSQNERFLAIITPHQTVASKHQRCFKAGRWAVQVQHLPLSLKCSSFMYLRRNYILFSVSHKKNASQACFGNKDQSSTGSVQGGTKSKPFIVGFNLEISEQVSLKSS